MEEKNLFRPEEAFFVIESECLEQVAEKLYGFAIVDGQIVEDVQTLGESPLTGDGAYVCVRKQNGKITVSQDFIGSYGLYLYEKGNDFALSNSFQYLVERIKGKHRITFDRDYANFLLTADLCSTAFSQTMVREIRMLDRAAVVEIDVAERRLRLHHVDYQENTVSLGSSEGMALLDRWYEKWTALLRNIRAKTTNMQVDLTGGFDSRMTIALLLGAGFDPGDIHVFSNDDNLYTHGEDYQIASTISSHYGFRLNNFHALSLDKVPVSMQDILNVSFYAKLGFHKQMYYSRWKHLTNFYYMGGSGGECVREYWRFTQEEYIEKAVQRCKSFPPEAARELETSVRRVLTRAFDQIREKFRCLGRCVDEDHLAMNLYRETRCRNHFGKDNVEHYLRGSYKFNPLLDPDLHKLKLTHGDCQDRNLLMAVIFGRYSRDLLDFPFEGGRSIAPETKACAIALNDRFPYGSSGKQRITAEVEAAPQSENYEEIHTLPAVRSHVEALFRCPGIKDPFVALFGEKTYNAVCDSIVKRSYFKLQETYGVIAISKLIQDARASENLCSGTLGGFLRNRMDSALVALPQEPNLKDHPYVTNYITARVDIKNGPEAGNDIVLLEASDPDARVTRPKWFQSNGSGCILESQKGRLSLTFRCIGSGKLSIALRSRDVRNAQGKRIPFWLDFTAFRLNGDTLIEGIRPIWHDAPMKLERDVRDGEVLTLYVEWAPHDARNE